MSRWFGGTFLTMGMAKDGRTFPINGVMMGRKIGAAFPHPPRFE
jgi:hypothetical protein